MVLNLDAAFEYLYPNPHAIIRLFVNWPIQLYRRDQGNAHEIDLRVLGNCQLYKNSGSE